MKNALMAVGALFGLAGIVACAAAWRYWQIEGFWCVIFAAGFGSFAVDCFNKIKDEKA